MRTALASTLVLGMIAITIFNSKVGGEKLATLQKELFQHIEKSIWVKRKRALANN